MRLPLAGKTVLIVRPRHQAEGLAARIRAAGGEPLVLPTLEIEPIAPDPGLQRILSRLAGFDLAVFVSPNAVQQGLPLLDGMGGWPRDLPAAAVGAATARELHARGIEGVIVPGQGSDSEALLALAPLQHVAGWRVVIFRGVGGREHLADTLRRRGAEVTYVECYRRLRPEIDVGPLLALLTTAKLHAVVAASAQALANLTDAVPKAQRPLLLAVPLLVVHAKIARAGADLGFEAVFVAGNGEAGLFEALLGELYERR